MQNAATRESYGALSWWQSKTTKTLLQILTLLGFGALAAIGKRFEPSLGIPGSSAPLWLGAMVAGRAVVRRDGAGALMGATVAVLGIPLGINNGFMHNLGLYTTSGLALDIAARLPKMNIRNPFGAIVSGAAAHMVKFGFILAAAMAAAVTKHFLVFGVLQTAGLHLAFGALAGLVGWGVYKLTTIRAPK